MYFPSGSCPGRRVHFPAVGGAVVTARAPRRPGGSSRAAIPFRDVDRAAPDHIHLPLLDAHLSGVQHRLQFLPAAAEVECQSRSFAAGRTRAVLLVQGSSGGLIRLRRGTARRARAMHPS